MKIIIQVFVFIVFALLSHYGNAQNPYEKTEIDKIQFSPNGKYFAISANRNMLVWVFNTGQFHALNYENRFIYDFGFSPDDEWHERMDLLTSSHALHEVAMWNPETGELVNEVFSYYSLFSLDYGPYGHSIFFSSPSNSVQCWSDVTNNIHSVIGYDNENGISRVKVHPQGKCVLVQDYKGKFSLHFQGKPEVVTYNNLNIVADFCFNPNGNQIAFADEKTIKVFDTTKGEQVTKSFEFSDKINSLIFHPDTEHLIICTDDKKVRVWNVKNNIEEYIFENFENEIKMASIHPNGTLLCIVEAGGVFHMYNYETKQKVSKGVVMEEEDGFKGLGFVITTPDENSYDCNSIGKKYLQQLLSIRKDTNSMKHIVGLLKESQYAGFLSTEIDTNFLLTLAYTEKKLKSVFPDAQVINDSYSKEISFQNYLVNSPIEVIIKRGGYREGLYLKIYIRDKSNPITKSWLTQLDNMVFRNTIGFNKYLELTKDISETKSNYIVEYNYYKPERPSSNSHHAFKLKLKK